MAAHYVDDQTPVEFRELAHDDRLYSSSPVWRVDVSSCEVRIRPRPLLRLGIVSLLLFALVGAGLYWSHRWLIVPEDVAGFLVGAAWWCWFLGAAFLAGVLLYERFRDRRAWFICRPMERTVSCPRLCKTFPIDDVYGLQVLTGEATRPDPEGRCVATFSQLNLIVKEEGILKRYPLVGDYRPGKLSRWAEVISERCGLPILRTRASSVAN